MDHQRSRRDNLPHPGHHNPWTLRRGWFINFPHVKAMCTPRDFRNVYRCPEVEQAIAKVLTFCDLSVYESTVFLQLVEALEKEREEMVLHHHGRIANLEAELKLTKTNDSSRDAPQMGSLGKRRMVESPRNETQSWTRTMPEQLVPSNLPTSQPTRATDSPARSRLAHTEGETGEDLSTRSKHKHKDPSKFKFKCNTCDKSFTRSTTLQEHRRSHNNERRWACQLCPKHFVRLKDRKRHEERQHTQKKIECGVSIQSPAGVVWEWGCHQRFAREDGLISHLRTEKGRRCLEPLLANEEYFLFRMVDEARDGEKFRCSQASNSCQKEFDGPEQFTQHLSAQAGKRCATEWIVHHVMKIYRGKSEESLLPAPSDGGEEQRLWPSRIDNRVPGRNADDDAGERHPKAPIPMSSWMSSTNMPLTAEARDKGPLENTGKNGGVSLSPVSGSVDPSKGLNPSELVDDEPPLSPNVSCDTEPPQPHGMLTSWVLAGQSPQLLWLPGQRFWVMIECSARLEGKFVFTFESHLETYDSDATVEFLGERSQHLHKLSCEIPAPEGREYLQRDVTIKIRPTLGKGQGQGFPCKSIWLYG
ncbi:hypothetical protein BGZ57DRAFT_611438 [Hyaloscypha finlandica]|nr:hypothetical protein BGZ57DRAFT_611438 [Hyaloscypha finlandica]